MKIKILHKKGVFTGTTRKIPFGSEVLVSPEVGKTLVDSGKAELVAELGESKNAQKPAQQRKKRGGGRIRQNGNSVSGPRGENVLPAQSGEPGADLI